jgi:hypothetical protein
MGGRLIFLHHDRGFLQKGRRKVAELDNGCQFKPIGRYTRRPSATNGVSMLRGDEESACTHKLGDPLLPRKASVELTTDVTVPQTNTGGREEDSKALERTLLKELGKMTP